MRLFDSHVHFHFPDFDADRSEVLARARAEGVSHFINVGTDVESSRASLAIAEQSETIWAAAGIHPHDAHAARDEDFEAIEALLAHPKMAAIGEVGLDFFRNLSPREVQEEVLVRFIGLHKKTGKPLIIHCRDAYEELIQLLQRESSELYRGVIHCFSGDAAFMKRLLDLGFYISFAGPLTYKKNEILREACRTCPSDRILVETDAPFLPPQTRRGKRNEPMYMTETASMAAELHQMDLERFSEHLFANTQQAFGLC